MMEQDFYSKKKRPGTLTVLLILTTVAALWNILSNGFLLSQTAGFPETRPQFEAQLKETAQYQSLLNMNDQFGPAMERFLDLCPAMPVMNLAVAVLTLLGASFMFRLKRPGFHFYTIAKILETFLPPVLFGPEFFSFWVLMINGAFVYFYSTFLKDMD